jgi:hypothetical protein
MESSIIEINGTYGSIMVHARSGHIVSRNHSKEYDDIVWFDPSRLTERVMDICGTAFVTDKGTYFRECTVSNEGWHYNLLFPLSF